MKPFGDPSTYRERRTVEFKEAVRDRYRASGVSVQDMLKGDPKATPERPPLLLTLNACYRVLSDIESVPTGPTVRTFLTVGLRLGADDVEELMRLYARIAETENSIPDGSVHADTPASPAGLKAESSSLGSKAAPFESEGSLSRSARRRRRPGLGAASLTAVGLAAGTAAVLISSQGTGGADTTPDPTFEQWVTETDSACLADLQNASRYEQVLSGAVTGQSSPVQIRKVADDISRDLQTRPGELPYPRVLHRAEAITAIQKLTDGVVLIRRLADQVAAKGDVLTVLRDIQSTVTDGNNRLQALGAVHCK